MPALCIWERLGVPMEQQVLITEIVYPLFVIWWIYFHLCSPGAPSNVPSNSFIPTLSLMPIILPRKMLYTEKSIGPTSEGSANPACRKDKSRSAGSMASLFYCLRVREQSQLQHTSHKENDAGDPCHQWDIQGAAYHRGKPCRYYGAPV